MKFDVVIIGASFAGLQCAKQLANSKFKVLIIDKKSSNKVCAGGVTLQDQKYIARFAAR